jgi:hypothetical protein
VALALRDFLERQPQKAWSGSARQLLCDLQRPDRVPLSHWPTNPTAMGSRLTRAAPSLRQLGIAITRPKRSGTARRWTFAVTPSPGGVTVQGAEESPEDLSDLAASDTLTPVTPFPATSEQLSAEALWGAEEVARARAELEAVDES